MLNIANNNKLVTENVQYYRSVYKYSSIQRLKNVGKMHGARRVLTFCCLTAVLPTVLIILPLYLRHCVFTDLTYAVAESDVIEVKDGISSIFCQKHLLRMNNTFNAYQIYGTPEISKSRKHIRLKKSIRLPDDTLEYWGFYLLKGATVSLKVCSRYEGSRILVVEGGKNLKTCGLLEHNKNKFGGHFAEGHNAVQVFFDSPAQEILDHHDENSQATFKNKNSSQISEERLEKLADSILEKRLSPKTHKRRHAKHKLFEIERLKKELYERDKRDVDLNSAVVLDGGVEHGGNAANFPKINEEESSASSFENGLMKCYDGQILLSREFSPNHNCTDVHFLDTSSTSAHEEHNIEQYRIVHNIEFNGYYYYIFYSDNDFVSNDIHAIFDIYKPTYQYTNISKTKACRNRTECSFSIPFWSDERVIVEVPTRDGIEHEEDDTSLLISVCQPRMTVYMIFPIAVLFLILVCAFI